MSTRNNSAVSSSSIATPGSHTNYAEYLRTPTAASHGHFPTPQQIDGSSGNFQDTNDSNISLMNHGDESYEWNSPSFEELFNLPDQE